MPMRTQRRKGLRRRRLPQRPPTGMPRSASTSLTGTLSATALTRKRLDSNLRILRSVTRARCASGIRRCSPVLRLRHRRLRRTRRRPTWLRLALDRRGVSPKGYSPPCQILRDTLQRHAPTPLPEAASAPAPVRSSMHLVSDGTDVLELPFSFEIAAA